MSVNGGTTTTSTRPESCFLSSRVHASFWTRTTASWWLRFDFQFPAISGVRVWAMGSAFQYGDAGQLFALEVLEAGAATGRDVAEGVLVEAEGAHRSRGVATAHHGEPIHLRQCLRDGPGALGEGGGLEDAHRAVPEDRPGAREGL